MLWQQKLQIKTKRHKEFLLILKLISSDCVINYNTIWLMTDPKASLALFCISRAIKKLIIFKFTNAFCRSFVFPPRTVNFVNKCSTTFALYFYHRNKKAWRKSTQCERSSDTFLAHNHLALIESLLIFLQFFSLYCVGCHGLSESISSRTSIFLSRRAFCFAYVCDRPKRSGENRNEFQWWVLWRMSSQQLAAFFFCEKLSLKWKWKSVNFNGSFRCCFVFLRFQFPTEICSLSSTSWIYMSF
jgi:hypothetical protein